ncbi:DUF3261 domain-containing protein [Paracidovorax avenae]
MTPRRAWIAVNPVRLAGLAAVAAALAGCGPDDGRCAPLPGGGQYCLQPTADVVPFDVQQKATVRFRGHAETMIVQMEVDAQGIRFVGLTPFGHKVVDVEYDNRAVRVHALPDRRLDARLLLALVQIAQWPADSVRAGLSASLSLDAADPHHVRVQDRDGATAVAVRREGSAPPYDRADIDLPGPGLALALDTLPAPDAAEPSP